MALKLKYSQHKQNLTTQTQLIFLTYALFTNCFNINFPNCNKIITTIFLCKKRKSYNLLISCFFLSQKSNLQILRPYQDDINTIQRELMKNYIFLASTFAVIFTTSTITSYDLVVIKDPIVDLCSKYPIPARVAIDEHGSRIHQGLFNELAHCVETQDDYVRLNFNNIKICTDCSPLNFWTHKSHILPIKNIIDQELRATIPHATYGKRPTIVLTYPWKHFSIGTRFKHLPEHDTTTHFCVMKADYKKNKPVLFKIPRENAMIEIKQTKKSSRVLFVSIINNLISRINHNNPGYAIPYVWGGNSFLKPYKTMDFYKKDNIWQRNGKNEPYTGYDCSGFITQMAQMAGIKFPWITSDAIHKHLPTLRKKDKLQNGDLIWIEHHIAIVSNIEHNEIIEARDYDSGYGCLHRIKLSEFIEEATTYEELMNLYRRSQKITLRNQQGKPQKEYDFKFLKLVA